MMEIELRWLGWGVDVTDHCARRRGNLNCNPYCSWSYSTPFPFWTMKRNEKEGVMGCGWHWEVVSFCSVLPLIRELLCIGCERFLFFLLFLLPFRVNEVIIHCGCVTLCCYSICPFILFLILLWLWLCIYSIRLLFFYWVGVAFCYLHHLWFAENEDCILKLFILTLSVLWNHCPLVVQSLNAYDMKSSWDL